QALGLEMLDALSMSNTLENVRLLTYAVRWNELVDGLADPFGGAVTEQLFGAAVPTRDVAVEVFADDGVIGRIHNGCQEHLVAFGSLQTPAIADISRDFGSPDDVAQPVFDRGNSQRDLDEAAVLSH